MCGSVNPLGRGLLKQTESALLKRPSLFLDEGEALRTKGDEEKKRIRVVDKVV